MKQAAQNKQLLHFPVGKQSSMLDSRSCRWNDESANSRIYQVQWLELDHADRFYSSTRNCKHELKHLDIKELWLQDMVKANRVRIKKESAATNWPDLGTKSLTGTRSEELLQIMPLTRRGIVVACLLCQVYVAKGQPRDQEETDGFWWYFLFVHMMALLSIVNLVQRAYNAIVCTRNRMSDKSFQTEGEVNASSSTPCGHGGASESSTARAKSSTDSHTSGQVRRRPLDDRVYLVGNGQRFHNEHCGMVRANMSRVRGVSRIQALRAGTTACQQCGG